MHIVIGIVVLFMIGVAMQVFDAVGGWPGVFLIVGVIAGGVWGISHLLARQEAIKQLRENPPRIATLVEHASALAATKPELVFGEMAAELEAERAPLFWDAFDARCNELADAIDAVDLARREASEYEEGARKYGLHPPRVEIELDLEGFDEIAEMYGRQLLEIRDGVLAMPAFAIVYEQRRSNEENRAMARALQRGLAAVGETT